VNREDAAEVPEYRFPRTIKLALYQCVRTGVDRPDIGLGIGALKSFVEKYSGGKVRVDTFTTLNRNVFFDSVKKNKYDLIGISSVSVVYNEALDVIDKLSGLSPSSKLLLGGAHVSCLGRTLPRGAIGVRGEGELTLLELSYLASRGRFAPVDLNGVAGISFWSDAELKSNPPRTLIRNIDIIPSFNRDYFTDRAPAAVFTIRGCPYDCDFCVNYLLWERKVRLHSPEWVVADLVALKNKNPAARTVVFRDDIMMLFPDRLKKMAELIINNDTINDLEFVVYGRVDCVSEEIIRVLKSMNVKCVLFGFESFSRRMLNIYKGERITPEANQKAIDICFGCGMKAGGNFIIGHPNETEDDIKITYEAMLDNFSKKKIQTGGNSILTPFPATPYWDIAKKKYAIDDLSFDWSRLNELSYLVARLDHCRDWSVHDWWDYREKSGMMYIGALEAREELLPLMQRYEPLMHKYLNI